MCTSISHPTRHHIIHQCALYAKILWKQTFGGSDHRMVVDHRTVVISGISWWPLQQLTANNIATTMPINNQHHRFSSTCLTKQQCKVTLQHFVRDSVTVNTAFVSVKQIFEISNRIKQLLHYSIRFEMSMIIQNFGISLNTYHHQFLTYLTECCRFFTLATMPSNQQNVILAIMANQAVKFLQQKRQQCGTYYWWHLRPTITIQFDSKWIKHYSHSTNLQPGHRPHLPPPSGAATGQLDSSVAHILKFHVTFVSVHKKQHSCDISFIL